MREYEKDVWDDEDFGDEKYPDFSEDFGEFAEEAYEEYLLDTFYEEIMSYENFRMELGLPDYSEKRLMYLLHHEDPQVRDLTNDLFWNGNLIEYLMQIEWDAWYCINEKIDEELEEQGISRYDDIDDDEYERLCEEAAIKWRPYVEEKYVKGPIPDYLR